VAVRRAVVGVDGREGAACVRLGAIVCDVRGATTGGGSSEASAPQCWQNDFVSDERRPQFWHSMREIVT